MAEWFTSDQHFGHRNIIEFSRRPFRDLEHMHGELVARHNAKVAPGDVVWHVGDFSLDDRFVRDFLPRLAGKHRLVAGNHDGCHPCHRRSEAAKRRYLMLGFEKVAEQVRHPAGFLLCHLPYMTSNALENQHEARFPDFRPKDEGGWLVHGHVHESWQVKGRQLNVGVDVWDFAPVSLAMVSAIVSGGENGIFERASAGSST
jgi:calcineurin-like phosphoesterase family protein